MKAIAAFGTSAIHSAPFFPGFPGLVAVRVDSG